MGSPNDDKNVPTGAAQQPVAKKQIVSALQKKLIVAIIGAIVVVGVAVLVLMLTVFAGPSKADYVKADDAAKKVRAEHRDVKSSLSPLTGLSSYASQGAIDRYYDSAKESLAGLKRADGNLKDQEAYRDADIKELYDDYSDKQSEYVARVSGYIASYKPVAKVSEACTSDFRELSNALQSPKAVIKDFDTAMTDCKDALKESKEVSNEKLAEYAEKTDKTLKNLREQVVDVQAAYKAKDRKKYDKALERMQDIINGYPQADLPKIATDLVEEVKNDDASAALDKLGKALNKKVEELK